MEGLHWLIEGEIYLETHLRFDCNGFLKLSQTV